MIGASNSPPPVRRLHEYLLVNYCEVLRCTFASVFHRDEGGGAFFEVFGEVGRLLLYLDKVLLTQLPALAVVDSFVGAFALHALELLGGRFPQARRRS